MNIFQGCQQPASTCGRGMTMKKARALLEQQLQLPPGALQPAKQMCSEIVDQVRAPAGVYSSQQEPAPCPED